MKRNPSTDELFAVWDDLSPERKIPRTPESWNRTPLVLARSSDGGRSWHGHIELENAPDHGYCYTAMHFTGDALLLGYCSGGGTSGVLRRSRSPASNTAPSPAENERHARSMRSSASRPVMPSATPQAAAAALTAATRA